VSDGFDRGEGGVPETRSVRDRFDTCSLYLTIASSETERLEFRTSTSVRRNYSSAITTMYATTWLAAAAATLFTVAFAQTEVSASSQDFIQALDSKDPLLVLFTSRSATSLQSYTTIFQSADRNGGTRFMTFDCDLESELCSEYDINSYPTIRLFELGIDGLSRHVTRYRGPKTVKAIRGWVKRRDLGMVTKIDGNELERFKEIDEIVVVAHLPSDDQMLLDEFTAVAAEQHHDHVFAYTTDSNVAKEQGLAVPSIKVFKNADNDHRILSNTFTSASLSSFLATAIPCSIRTFREKDLDMFMQRDKLTLYIFTSIDSPRAEALRRQLTPLAKKYEKYVTFAVADAVKHAEMATNLLSRFGGQGKDEHKKTRIAVHAPLNDNVFRYALGKELEVESIESMIKTILQGKAKSGDIFGSEAADLDEEEGNGHDEL
jgi:hypothetical protein